MARPRQFDEDKILAAVRDQFWRQGYAATSLAKREAANANAITASFVPFISSHGERYTSKRISEKDESPDSIIFL